MNSISLCGVVGSDRLVGSCLGLRVRSVRRRVLFTCGVSWLVCGGVGLGYLVLLVGGYSDLV